MSKIRIMLRLLTLSVFTLTFASFAQAQATRTWVSGTGSDANPCSRTAPCQTFAGALVKTFIHGEIDALDPSGFGAVTINKSITIDGGKGSGWASILASGVNGVIINIAVNANDPFREVVLRNISINGSGASGAIGTRTGLNGISYLQGLSVTVEDCQISSFSQNAINVNLTATGAVAVRGTSLLNSNKGFSQTISAGTLNSTLDDVFVSGNTTSGVEVLAGTVNVSNSVVNKNGAGIQAAGSVGSVVNVDNTQVTNNVNAGIQAVNGFGTVRINNNNVYRNGTGLSNAGTMQTFNNNKVIGNTTDVTGVLTNVTATNIK